MVCSYIVPGSKLPYISCGFIPEPDSPNKDFYMSNKPPLKPTVKVHPITSAPIKRLAGIGEKTPSKLSNQQVQSLAASVQRHIEPRGGKIK